VHLPENLRADLKRPLGVLLKDADATKENIQKNIPANSVIISVGDTTTEKLIKHNIIPSLQIVDGLEKRVKKELPPADVRTSLSCSNPAAEITTQSIDTIKRAFQSPKPVRITVIGEEDLLVLPVCVFAPENSVIFYGQPNEGLVIVKINPQIRNKAQSIMDSMS